MGINDYLKECLEKSGKTQADIARETGLSTAIISQIFTGRTKNPRMSNIVPIVKAVGASMDKLIEYYYMGLEDD